MENRLANVTAAAHDVTTDDVTVYDVTNAAAIAPLTGLLLSLIIVITLVGNALVCAAVVSFRRLRSSVTNYFVVSLAVADLTVALLVMPYSVEFELNGRWRHGWAFCYFWISCDVTCCTASILHLCVIAVDRYIAITEPLRYRERMSKRRALLAIGAVWLCSGAISFVPIYAGWFIDPAQMSLYVDSDVCGLHVNKTYAVISSMTSFYVPLVVMVIVYARIYRIARKQADEIRHMEQSLVPRGASPGDTTRLRQRSRRATDDSKAIKTLGTLMGLFCVSWLPFFLIYLVTPFCQQDCQIPAAAVSAVTWLGYLNSSINPCVYAWLNRDFRAAFRRIIFCGDRGGRGGAARPEDAYERGGGEKRRKGSLGEGIDDHGANRQNRQREALHLRPLTFTSTTSCHETAHVTTSQIGAENGGIVTSSPDSLTSSVNHPSCQNNAPMSNHIRAVTCSGSHVVTSSSASSPQACNCKVTSLERHHASSNSQQGSEVSNGVTSARTFNNLEFGESHRAAPNCQCQAVTSPMTSRGELFSGYEMTSSPLTFVVESQLEFEPNRLELDVNGEAQDCHGNGLREGCDELESCMRQSDIMVGIAVGSCES